MTVGPERRRHPIQWVESSVRFAVLLTVLLGAVNLLSAVTPALPERNAVLRGIVPQGVRHGARLASVLTGFGLLILARSLWRRKRAAWVLVTALLSTAALSHLLKGLDYEEAALSALLVAWLIVLRPHFQARSDPPSVRQGVIVLAAAVFFTLVYGTAGFYLLDRHFRERFSLSAALTQTLIMFVEFYDPGLQPVTTFGRNFADSIYVVGAVTLGYAILALSRPVLLRGSPGVQERERAREIVEAHGQSSLARLTLLPDKAYFFSPGGSVVAYAVNSGVAVALGDVIGPPDDLPKAIAAFQAYCARNDWRPAFYQTLPDFLGEYRAAGFDILCIGHEAIVELSAFSLEGREAGTLRRSHNRLTRLGYRTEIHAPPLAEGLLAELRVVSDEWLTMVHGAEKGFSLGWFDEEYIRGGPVMAVHTPDGRITAFANILPEYQRAESTADLMRRRRTAESGTMDFLFVGLLRWAQAQGYVTFSLGLSPFAGVGAGPTDPAVERALHFIYEHVNQFYSFKGLHEFKEKFRPRWSPRYLAYPGIASLPAVALAILRADSGEGFVWDHLREVVRKPLLRLRRTA